MTPGRAAPRPNGQLLPFRESVLAMLGIAFVAMLVALDQTIVGTALPRIVADLKGFDLYAWVATSYMLASVITIPIFGRLGDLFGRKPFLVAAIVLFTCASVLCGVASSMLLLVIARGVQGIGGGILIGTVFATVADLFPNPKLRLRWLVFVTSAFGIANMVGPTLGGLLTQYGGWCSSSTCRSDWSRCCSCSAFCRRCVICGIAAACGSTGSARSSSLSRSVRCNC